MKSGYLNGELNKGLIFVVQLLLTIFMSSQQLIASRGDKGVTMRPTKLVF